MLLAVEGGGFFSSSASGYSSGLTLLLLGQRNEERPTRVSPWNQYQLVDQELDPDVQLASKENRVSHGCALFVCFGCTSAGLDAPPPEVGPAHQVDSLTDASACAEGIACTANDADDRNRRKVCLKSSLKKTHSDCVVVVTGDSVACETMDEVGSNANGHTEKRTVQWTDACGGDLAEIKEFELSDEASSDEESERELHRRCECQSVKCLQLTMIRGAQSCKTRCCLKKLEMQSVR